MKTTILSLIVTMIIPAISSAKVEDFNAMIAENAKSQEVLHTDLKEQMNETRQAQFKGGKREAVALTEELSSFNSPTSKSLLTFQKETLEYRASEPKKLQRLANEIKQHDAAF
ncbi:MAG: hypothetical protein IPM97_06085 [Bdellovibrionaceae bacterium]|nr:hypothetical protein [Pseudobdellovibrionaceae bacterium]